MYLERRVTSVTPTRFAISFCDIFLSFFLQTKYNAPAHRPFGSFPLVEYFEVKLCKIYIVAFSASASKSKSAINLGIREIGSVEGAFKFNSLIRVL